MSATAPPAPPARLPAPKRGVRRMNSLPLAIGVGVCASVVGLAWYVIHSGPGSFGTIDMSDDSRSASASDVLAAAPAGVIPPTTGPIASPAPATRSTQQQAVQPAKPAPA